MKPDQYPSFSIASGVCVEVGTWDGGFSEALLSKSDVTKVYCVDPYKSDSTYLCDYKELSQAQFDAKYKNTKTRLETMYGNKVEFIRLTSVEASHKFADGSLDYVYIDGNHDYKYVLEDLQSWYPKIKPGGILAGDDIYSTDLNEHDINGNVRRMWGPTCWADFGVYKALVHFGKPFTIDGTQFKIIC